jgi:hypothetical protein
VDKKKKAIHHRGAERTEKNDFQSVACTAFGEPDVRRPFTAFLFYWGFCRYFRFDPNLKTEERKLKASP